MAGTGGARDRHNGRRQGILDRSLDEVRSKHREVKMTGGAHAHCSIMCWFWQVDVPDPNVVRNGGMEMSLVMHTLEGLKEAPGAERRPR